jgi:hypothetical protein
MSDGDSESKSKHGGKMPKLEGTVTFENGAKKFVVHLKAMRSYFKLHHNGHYWEKFVEPYIDSFKELRTMDFDDAAEEQLDFYNAAKAKTQEELNTFELEVKTTMPEGELSDYIEDVSSAFMCILSIYQEFFPNDTGLGEIERDDLRKMRLKSTWSMRKLVRRMLLKIKAVNLFSIKSKEIEIGEYWTYLEEILRESAKEGSHNRDFGPTLQTISSINSTNKKELTFKQICKLLFAEDTKQKDKIVKPTKRRRADHANLADYDSDDSNMSEDEAMEMVSVLKDCLPKDPSCKWCNHDKIGHLRCCTHGELCPTCNKRGRCACEVAFLKANDGGSTGGGGGYKHRGAPKDSSNLASEVKKLKKALKKAKKSKKPQGDSSANDADTGNLMEVDDDAFEEIFMVEMDENTGEPLLPPGFDGEEGEYEGDDADDSGDDTPFSAAPVRTVEQLEAELEMMAEQNDTIRVKYELAEKEREQEKRHVQRLKVAADLSSGAEAPPLPSTEAGSAVTAKQQKANEALRIKPGEQEEMARQAKADKTKAKVQLQHHSSVQKDGRDPGVKPLDIELFDGNVVTTSTCFVARGDGTHFVTDSLKRLGFKYKRPPVGFQGDEFQKPDAAKIPMWYCTPPPESKDRVREWMMTKMKELLAKTWRNDLPSDSEDACIIKRLFGPAFEAVYESSLYDIVDERTAKIKTEPTEIKTEPTSSYATPTVPKTHFGEQLGRNQLESEGDEAEGNYLSTLAKVMHDIALNCGKRTRMERDEIKRLVTELDHEAVQRALKDTIKMERDPRARPQALISRLKMELCDQDGLEVGDADSKFAVFIPEDPSTSYITDSKEDLDDFLIEGEDVEIMGFMSRKKAVAWLQKKKDTFVYPHEEIPAALPIGQDPECPRMGTKIDGTYFNRGAVLPCGGCNRCNGVFLDMHVGAIHSHARVLMTTQQPKLYPKTMDRIKEVLNKGLTNEVFDTPQKVQEENELREAVFTKENSKYNSPKRSFNGNRLGKKKNDGCPDMTSAENYRPLKEDEKVLLAGLLTYDEYGTVSEPLHLHEKDLIEAKSAPMTDFEVDEPRVDALPEIRTNPKGAQKRTKTTQNNGAHSTTGSDSNEIFYVCLSPVVGIFADERSMREAIEEHSDPKWAERDENCRFLKRHSIDGACKTLGKLKPKFKFADVGVWTELSAPVRTTLPWDTVLPIFYTLMLLITFATGVCSVVSTIQTFVAPALVTQSVHYPRGQWVPNPTAQQRHFPGQWVPKPFPELPIVEDHKGIYDQAKGPLRSKFLDAWRVKPSAPGLSSVAWRAHHLSREILPCHTSLSVVGKNLTLSGVGSTGTPVSLSSDGSNQNGQQGWTKAIISNIDIDGTISYVIKSVQFVSSVFTVMLALFAATRAFNHRYYWKRWLIGGFIMAVLFSSAINPIEEINIGELRGTTFKSRSNVSYNDARVDHTPSTYGKYNLTKRYRFRTIPIKIDSGATSHVWNIPGDVTNWTSREPGTCIGFQGSSAATVGRGDVPLLIKNETSGQWVRHVLHDCAIIPAARHKLISVSKLENEGIFPDFKAKMIDIGMTRVKFTRIGNLYNLNAGVCTDEIAKSGRITESLNLTLLKDKVTLEAKVMMMKAADVAMEAATAATHCTHAVVETMGKVSALLHQRFAHLGEKHQRLISKCSWIPYCMECATGKAAKTKQNRGSRTKPLVPFHTIHMDIAGPFKHSEDGYRWAISFTCGYSNWTHVYFMERKSDALEMFALYVEDTWIKLKRPISFLQTDNDSVFTSEQFQDFCASIGVEMHFSSPDTPAENGKAERKWRFIKDGTRVLLTQAKRDAVMWTHAMKVFTYSVNRLPTRSNPDWKSPYEMLYGAPPALKHFRKWGVPCVVTKYYDKKGSDFSPKGREGIFLGYAANHSPGSYLVLMKDTNRIVVSKNVKFDEGVVLDVLNAANATIGRQTRFSDTSGLENAETQLPKRSSVKAKEPKQRTSKGVAPGPRRGTHLPKFSKHDVICKSDAPSRLKYINDRVDSLDGLTIAESLGKSYTNAKGVVKKYGKQDLHYDVKHGYVNIQPAPSDATLEQVNLEQEVVMEVTNSILKRDEEVAIEVNTPDGDFEVLVTTDPAKFTRNSPEPKSLKDAMNMEDSGMWKDAVIKELTALRDMGTYRFVSLPHGRKAVGCKMVLTRKFNSDGTLAKYKARCVLKGYRQREGVDYQEIFSPTPQFISFRVMLALANHHDWTIRQCDFYTAFLNSDMDAELYMELPEGIDLVHKRSDIPPNPALLILRGLYGAKQASRLWSQMLNKSLVKRGFKACTNDACFYIKRTKNGGRLIVLAYVDDICITGDSDAEIEDLIKSLSDEYRRPNGSDGIEDRGVLEWFLGMRIRRDRKRRVLTVDHSQYITDMLEKYDLKDAAPASLPLPTTTSISRWECPKNTTKEGREAVEKLLNWPYLSANGALLWCGRAIRADIAYPTHLLSMFAANPSQASTTSMKQVFRYLKKTKDLSLVFESKPGTKLDFNFKAFGLTGYVDASYADNYGDDTDNRRSTTGYVFTLGGTAVSWKSTKQQVVACSTAESEYIAAYEASREAICLRRMLTDLGEAGSSSPVILHEDNQACIKLSENPCAAQRTKSMDVKYHFLRQAVQEGKIKLEYISTHDQLADIFTKMLPQPQFLKLRSLIGLRDYIFQNDAATAKAA